MTEAAYSPNDHEYGAASDMAIGQKMARIATI